MKNLQEELERLQSIGVVVCENEVRGIEDIPREKVEEAKKNNLAFAIWTQVPKIIDKRENIISDTEKEIEISVFNSYHIKDKLKQMGYRWDIWSGCWKKRIE
jgi:dTDP-glucose pyrophosphorylase